MTNAEYCRKWRTEHPDHDRIYKKALRIKYKEAVYTLLGNRCSNPNCRYLNDDGTLGCTDIRLLHIDHIKGGGRREREAVHGNVRTLHKKILKTEGKGYRLLCANCNWLHLRHEVI